MRTAKSCGPDASVVGVKSAEENSADDGVNKARSPGRVRISRKPLRGECRVKPVRPDERVCVLSLPLHTRLAGASSARHSLRPLFGGRRTKEQTSSKSVLRDREAVSALFEIRISLSSPGLTGRPSIPEAPVIEPHGRGVLD